MQDNIINKIHVCIFVFVEKNLKDTQDETLLFSQLNGLEKWLNLQSSAINSHFSHISDDWMTFILWHLPVIYFTYLNLYVQVVEVFLSLLFFVSVFFKPQSLLRMIIKKSAKCRFRFWYIFFFCITCKILFTVFPRGLIKHDSILY